MKYNWIHREIVENPDKPIIEVLRSLKRQLNRGIYEINKTCVECPDKFAGCEECRLSAKYNELYAKYSELQDFMKEYEVREIL